MLNPLEANVALGMVIIKMCHRILAVRVLTAIHASAGEQAGQFRDGDAIKLFLEYMVNPLLKIRNLRLQTLYQTLSDLPKEHACFTSGIYVPADFDTIENAFSGAKPPKKAYNKGFRGRFLTSKALFVFIQLECRCQAS